MTTTVEVTGQASVSVAPDTMLVRIEVEAGGSSAPLARDREQDCRETVLESLCDVVDEQDVRMESKTIEATSNLFDTEIEEAYIARTTLEVQCLPSSVEQVVVTATDDGALVERVDPKVADAKREQLRAELLSTAVENAREQAKQIASTVGQPIDHLNHVATTDTRGFDSVVDGALTTQVSLDASEGPVEFSTTVTATYELEPTTAPPES